MLMSPVVIEVKIVDEKIVDDYLSTHSQTFPRNVSNSGIQSNLCSAVGYRSILAWLDLLRLKSMNLDTSGILRPSRSSQIF